MKNKIKLDINISNSIKIFALVLMFCHHFLNESWIYQEFKYISIFHIGRYTPEMIICDTGKICVAIFAFLTGYGMHFSFQKDSSALKVVKRISKFLLKYWMVIFTLFIPAYFIIFSNITWSTIIKAMFGLESSINLFSWYVYFYLISLVLLWLWHKMITRGGSQLFQMLLNLFVICTLILPFIQINNSIIENILVYFPATLVGYTLAQYGVIEAIIVRLDRFLPPRSQILIGVLGGGAVLLLRYAISMITHWYIWNQLDTLFAVLLVVFIILIEQNMTLPKSFLYIAGKATTNMWFLHAIFFGVYEKYTQKIAYFPRISVLIIIWVTALCFFISVVYDKIYDWILGCIIRK